MTVRVLTENWINEKLSTDPDWELSDIVLPEEQQSEEIQMRSLMYVLLKYINTV